MKATEKEKQNFKAYYQANKHRWKVGYQKRCKERKGYCKNLNLKKKYNISLEEYLEMANKQGGVCLICAKPETLIDPRTQSTRDLSVDHCHQTGKVRGLLCAACNGGLGLFKDNLEALKSAINYLEASKCA